MRTRKTVEIEWAFRAKVDRVVTDVDTWNKRNCHWDEPIEKWGEKILNDGWIVDHVRRKYGRSVKLVKRTIVHETVWRAR